MLPPNWGGKILGGGGVSVPVGRNNVKIGRTGRRASKIIRSGEYNQEKGAKKKRGGTIC